MSMMVNGIRYRVEGKKNKGNPLVLLRKNGKQILQIKGSPSGEQWMLSVLAGLGDGSVKEEELKRMKEQHLQEPCYMQMLAQSPPSPMHGKQCGCATPLKSLCECGLLTSLRTNELVCQWHAPSQWKSASAWLGCRSSKLLRLPTHVPLALPLVPLLLVPVATRPPYGASHACIW